MATNKTKVRSLCLVLLPPLVYCIYYFLNWDIIIFSNLFKFLNKSGYFQISLIIFTTYLIVGLFYIFWLIYWFVVNKRKGNNLVKNIIIKPLPISCIVTAFIFQPFNHASEKEYAKIYDNIVCCSSKELVPQSLYSNSGIKFFDLNKEEPNEIYDFFEYKSKYNGKKYFAVVEDIYNDDLLVYHIFDPENDYEECARLEGFFKKATITKKREGHSRGVDYGNHNSKEYNDQEKEYYELYENNLQSRFGLITSTKRVIDPRQFFGDDKEEYYYYYLSDINVVYDPFGLFEERKIESKNNTNNSGSSYTASSSNTSNNKKKESDNQNSKSSNNSSYNSDFNAGGGMIMPVSDPVVQSPGYNVERTPQKRWHNVTRTEDCHFCWGSGNCSTCNGKGYAYGIGNSPIDCRNCWYGGKGKCSHCQGRGKIEKIERVFE